MSAPPLFVGSDGAKAQLDMAVRPSGERGVVAHDDAGIAALVARLQALQPTLLVFEATGLGELPELIRQSEEYAAAWKRRGLAGRYLPVAGHDHFSILEELARPDGAILEALKALDQGRP